MAQSLDDAFPNHWDPVDFASAGLGALGPFGFVPHNTIAAVSVCRDELCRPFAGILRQCWGESFNLSCLAGVPLLGRTGFAAALHHAPDMNVQPRYVFFAFPHIALSQDGQWGQCLRPGQTKHSSACGALSALWGEIEAAGSARACAASGLRLDVDDLEQSALRTRLLPRLDDGELDLLTLTSEAADLATEELRDRVEEGISPEADYALFVGIQIHTPGGDRIFSRCSEARIGGRSLPLPLLRSS